MISKADLRIMQNASLQNCNAAELVDLRNIQIDRSKPLNQRLSSLIHGIDNPYLFKVGDVVVKIQCNPSGKTFSEALVACLSEG